MNAILGREKLRARKGGAKRGHARAMRPIIAVKIEAFLMVIDKIMLLLLPRNYRDILVVAMVESVNVLSL